jgi:hypothetical protein
MSWWGGEGVRPNKETHICRALGREFGEKIGRLTCNGMFGMNKSCHGCQAGADGEESVTDIIAEHLLVVLAAEKMIPVHVKGLVTVAARSRQQSRWEEG